MKKWTRWEDYVAGAAGLFAVLAALIWTPAMGASRVLMLVFGALLVITAVINLSMPGTPWLEYGQLAVGLLLFLSPWMGSYASASMSATSAAWTSWVAGLVATTVTAAAIRPAMNAHHHRMQPQH